jgi:dienelactone hydrolase
MPLETAVAICLAVAATGAAPVPESPRITVHRTLVGTRFAMIGDKPSSPAPTVFTFSADIAQALGADPYRRTALWLARRGWLCVTLDLPAHGEDRRPHEPEQLQGWRARFDAGEPFAEDFERRVADVLNHLIAEGYTDARRVAVCGTSRGGYIALRIAAADPRFRCVAAFAPVTVPVALREFWGHENNPSVHALDIERRAESLTGRPVWMCIGDHDERVGTANVIALAQRLIAAAVARKLNPRVDLHVMAVEGHSVYDGAYEDAGAWILAQSRESHGASCK